jgi:hypothetical protein
VLVFFTEHVVDLLDFRLFNRSSGRHRILP